MASVFKKVEAGIEGIFEKEKHSHSHLEHLCDHLHPETHTQNRYNSFAPQNTGNIKWFVDGASYFWAVSEALERRDHSSYRDFDALLTRELRSTRVHLHLGLVAQSGAVS